MDYILGMEFIAHDNVLIKGHNRLVRIPSNNGVVWVKAHEVFNVSASTTHLMLGIFLEKECTLLHIVPFCETPNKKPEGFAKQKQPAIFAMRHASHLMVHHPSLIYNVLYNHRNTFATYTTKKTLRPA